MAAVGTSQFLSVRAFEIAPATVRDYVAAHQLLPNLQDMLALSATLFEVVGPISLALEEDPDTGERWVEIDVAARGNVDDIMRAHREFLVRTSASRCGNRIRLFLQVAED